MSKKLDERFDKVLLNQRLASKFCTVCIACGVGGVRFGNKWRHLDYLTDSQFINLLTEEEYLMGLFLECKFSPEIFALMMIGKTEKLEIMVEYLNNKDRYLDENWFEKFTEEEK
jgi:hypothetical protein